MAVKLLVSGMPKTFKTYTLSKLPEALHIFYDDKAYPYKAFNVKLNTIRAMDDGANNRKHTVDKKYSLKRMIIAAIGAYKKKNGKLPKYITLDALNKMYRESADYIVNNTFNQKGNLDTQSGWGELAKNVDDFNKWIESFLVDEYNINVIYVMHSYMNNDTPEFLEYGSFKKNGGWLGLFNNSLYFSTSSDDDKLSSRTVHFRGEAIPARSTLPLEELPDSMPLNEFDINEYIQKLTDNANEVNEFSLEI
jgi:hypothetical protein